MSIIKVISKTYEFNFGNVIAKIQVTSVVIGNTNVKTTNDSVPFRSEWIIFKEISFEKKLTIFNNLLI